jgi:hypothetical protein
MKKEQPAKATLLDLSRDWQQLLDLDGISTESEYRIRKLIDRAGPLADKMFIKTVKARELMQECAEKTRLVHDHLVSRGELLYDALTDLERVYEDLLKRTYEFRVKAG